MTKEEAIKQLSELDDDGDNEEHHLKAEGVLLARLEALGESDLSQAFRDASDRHQGGFWYS